MAQKIVIDHQWYHRELTCSLMTVLVTSLVDRVVNVTEWRRGHRLHRYKRFMIAAIMSWFHSYQQAHYSTVMTWVIQCKTSEWVTANSHNHLQRSFNKGKRHGRSRSNDHKSSIQNTSKCSQRCIQLQIVWSCTIELCTNVSDETTFLHSIDYQWVLFTYNSHRWIQASGVTQQCTRRPRNIRENAKFVVHQH